MHVTLESIYIYIYIIHSMFTTYASTLVLASMHSMDTKY